ncbi:MAG: carbohydrate-binding protein, partial [Bacilli bacterium]|nr:carbohydrate-binding protein [Bacilli bacterium]
MVKSKLKKLGSLAIIALLLLSLLPTIAFGATSAWAPNTAYAVNDLVTYNSSTYSCIQAHTSQVGWEPPNTPALWALQSGSPTPTPTPTPTATPTPTPAPSGAAIPGKIEAESYSAMSGIQTETTTDTGGGLNVGYIDTGDWMDYSVNVQSAGTYTVGFRVASINSTGQLQLKNGAGTVLTTVNVPNTGGWQT